MKYIGTQIIEAEKAYKYIMPGGRNFIVADREEVGEEESQALHECLAAERGYKIRHENGHVSWCPSDVFEENYHPMGGMGFGLALEAAKLGKRISRKGWNCKDMSVAYQKGYPEGIPCNKNTAVAWGMDEGELFRCMPYLQIRCADGSFQMWAATQSDMLAEDWMIVEQ